MKIVLAIAPWSHAETYPPSQGRSNFLSGKFGMLGGATPPLSLLYLSSVLKRAGHETKFVDGFFFKREAFIEEVLSFEPDVLGFWCTQFSWERTKELAADFKQRSPSLRIVVGGTFATAYGKRGLEDANSGGIDYLVVGDGEEAIVELCEVVAGHRETASIQGLIWRNDGQVVVNQPRPFKENLDENPFPDYDLLDINQYSPAIGSYKCLPSVNMMTVRGCAGTCSFCHAANSLRMRSVENVLEEIRWLQSRYGVRHLLFFDETFTMDRDRVIEVCRRLEEEKIRIWWTCNARVDTIDPELVQIMKKAGCWRLQFGVESGVQKQLDTIEKGVTPEDARRAIVMAKRGGMKVFASFMFGIPGETYEEGLETIRYARTLPIDYVNFLNFIPLCGTQFWSELDRHGKMVGPTAFHRIAFVPHSMTYEQLADLMVRSIKQYYFRPSFLVKQFFKQRSLEDVKRNLRGFMAFVRMDARKDYLEQRAETG